jgi:cytoskeleton protein RodZ
MVGVALDDIMTDYYKMTRSISVPPIIAPVRNRHRDINAAPWILGFLVLAIVVAVAYWWIVLRTPAPASSGGTEPVPRPAVSRPLIPADKEEAAPAEAADSGEQAVTIEAMPDSEQTEPAPATGEPAAGESSALAAQPPPQAAASEGQTTLRLTFSGDCWTEISDATGERLFYDLGAAGRVVTLAGEPPFRVILGDADNASLTVDGRDYPIPESSRRGRLARLTIN